VKTWALRNSGTEPWPENVELQVCGTNYFFSNGGKSFANFNLEPDAVRELSISLIAPKTPGMYAEHFALRNCATGQAFGPYLRVEIVVTDTDDDWDDLAVPDLRDCRDCHEIGATDTEVNLKKDDWKIELSMLAEMGFTDVDSIIPVLEAVLSGPVINRPELNGQPKEEEIHRVVNMLLN
jgi:Ig-like domain from next to BRCA1 gene